MRRPTICGPLHVHDAPHQLSKLFEALVTDRERDESYDVSSQSDVYVVLDDGKARKLDVLRWGVRARLGEGHQDRQPHDQRSRRIGTPGHEAPS
jgi:putative SOS response-associated peptidase YedK